MSDDVSTLDIYIYIYILIYVYILYYNSIYISYDILYVV